MRITSHSGAGWKSVDNAGRGRDVPSAAREPAWKRFHGARRFLGQPREHVEVLPFDDRPLVVAAEVLASAAAEDAADGAGPFERVQRFGELLAGVVVQAASAADGLAFEHVAGAVDEHRTSECPGLEQHHRQTLVERRHDQHVGGGKRVELVLIGDEAEVPHARVVRNRNDGRADEDEVETAWMLSGVAIEILEELRAAFVRVDAADVNRERAADVVLTAEAPSLCMRRDGGAYADDG